MKKFPSSYLLLFSAVFINCLWAISYPISKMMLAKVSPLVLTTWRMGITSLMFLPFIKRPFFPPDAKKSEFLLVFLMGVWGGVGATFLQYFGTNYTLTSNVSLMVTLETLVLVLLSWIFLKEKLDRYAVISLLLALLGVALISVEPKSLDLFSGKYFFGNFIIFLSVVCYALYSVIGKVLSKNWNIVNLTFYPFLISFIFLLPTVYAINEEDFFIIFKLYKLPPVNIFYVLYLAVVATGISYYIWNWLLKFVDAGILGLSLYVQSIVGILISYFLFDEVITREFYLGTAAIFTALAIDYKRIKNCN